MREILFRGKRKDNGEWVYGNIVSTRSGRMFRLEGGFFTGKSVEGDFQHGGFYGVELIPETVGQYTGLKDKNGTRIFEGDILKSHTYRGTRIYTVDWCSDCAMFVLPCITNEKWESDFGIHCGEDFEIIGNVHDHSELLEGGDENARRN